MLIINAIEPLFGGEISTIPPILPLNVLAKAGRVDRGLSKGAPNQKI